MPETYESHVTPAPEDKKRDSSHVSFALIGVGLYSLFIEPLNLTAALGVESGVDLETKVISVVVVILAVTFLQHFICRSLYFT